VALGDARQKSRDAARVDSMTRLETALNLYYKDAGVYPTELSGGKPLSYENKVYLEEVPVNPLTQAGGPCMVDKDYSYARSEDGKSYTVEYCLESGINDMKPGVYQLTPDKDTK
jgi:hypothetical protein